MALSSAGTLVKFARWNISLHGSPSQRFFVKSLPGVKSGSSSSLCKNLSPYSNFSPKPLFRSLSFSGKPPTETNSIEFLSKFGDVSSVIDNFEASKKEVKYDLKSINTIINIYGQRRNLEEMGKWFKRIEKEGYTPDTDSYNPFIEYFCDREDMRKALEWIKEMRNNGQQPNQKTYNTLLKNYSRSGNVDKVVEIFSEMKSFRIPLSTFSYNCIMGMFQRLGLPNKVLEFEQQMIQDRVPLNEATRNILARTKRIKMASLQQKRRVAPPTIGGFEQMRTEGIKPNVTTCNLMFDSLRRRSPPEYSRMWDLYNQMPKEGVTPQSSTYNILLLSFIRKSSTMEWIRGLWEDIVRLKAPPNIDVINRTIPAVCAWNEYDYCEKIFEDTLAMGVKPDMGTFAMMIEASGSANRTERIPVYLERMKEFGLTPDSKFYASLIRGYVRAWQVGKAVEVFDRMKEENIPLMYNCICSLIFSLEHSSVPSPSEEVSGYIRRLLPTIRSRYGQSEPPKEERDIIEKIIESYRNFSGTPPKKEVQKENQ